MDGLNANDIDGGLWELGILNSIGRQINIDNITTLSELLITFIADEKLSLDIRELREASLFNYRSVGEVASAQLLSLRNELSSVRT